MLLSEVKLPSAPVSGSITSEGVLISNLAAPPRLIPKVAKLSITSYLARSSSLSSMVLSIKISSLLRAKPISMKLPSLGVAVPSGSTPSIPTSRSLSPSAISSGLALRSTSTPRSRLARYASTFKPSILSTPTSNDLVMFTLMP